MSEELEQFYKLVAIIKHYVPYPECINNYIKNVESALKTIEPMKKVLHYKFTNHFIVKDAFDEGWIGQIELDNLIKVYGSYNCIGKEVLK